MFRMCISKRSTSIFPFIKDSLQHLLNFSGVFYAFPDRGLQFVFSVIFQSCIFRRTMRASAEGSMDLAGVRNHLAQVVQNGSEYRPTTVTLQLPLCCMCSLSRNVHRSVSDDEQPFCINSNASFHYTHCKNQYLWT